MKLILALDNVRSAHNVGALLRSALGFNLDSVVTIGITPHMKQPSDPRLPHVVDKAERMIAKTALGGERLLKSHFDSSADFLAWSRAQDLTVVSIELSDKAKPIENFQAQTDTIIVLGHEVDGVSEDVLEASEHLCIPISPAKESYNVASAGAIAMYALHRQFATLEL